MRPLRRLQSWWWNRIHPGFDEPDFDDISHAARLQFVAGSRHPSECDSGCICRWSEAT